jgi:hypothetical protein
MANQTVGKDAPSPGDVPTDEQRRNQERRVALARLSRAAAEAGLYDRNEFPEGGQDE